jgi:diguanylate cyclase (GGDEF)-like protein
MSKEDTPTLGLRSSGIFSSLPEITLRVIEGYSERVSYPNATPVFTAGEAASALYIIVSGEIAVYRPGEYGPDSEIARLVAGDTLGELDLISAKPRQVSAKAAADSTMIRFPSRGLSFRDFLAAEPDAGARLLLAFIREIADRTRTANSLLKENTPAVQELRRQIYEDTLTGLKNKTWLEETLPQILTERPGPLTLFLFKPDNFKAINDSSGHEAGDSLLVYLAHRLPAILPPHATLVKYAGNEFGVVLPGADRAAAIEFAGEIRAFYGSQNLRAFINDPTFRLSVSIGIALRPDHGVAAETLIEAAHRLPLVGRAQGGNRILFPEDAPEASE